jgi:outer membrane protein assembly factor BamD (BamD/ComL family)
LDQWFDTRFFGGPVDIVEHRPEAARPALKMFEEIAAKYPGTKAAPMARYYAAVMLEWCFNERAAALAEYRRFVSRYPSADKRYLTRAQARIAFLEMSK